MFRQFDVEHENVQWKPDGLLSRYRVLTPYDRMADQIQVAVKFGEDFFNRLQKAYPTARFWRVIKQGFQGDKFVIRVEVEFVDG